MLMKSLMLIEKPFEVTSLDRRKCKMIAWYVCVQCLVVFIGAASVLGCVWNPDFTNFEVDKIARVMYLYHPKACHYQLSAEHGITNLRLSNDTLGGKNINPIEWAPAIITVSTRILILSFYSFICLYQMSSLPGLVVFIGAASVLGCVWNPDFTNFEVDKIARVMYLYDPKACHYQLSAEHGITNLRLSNDTLGGKNIYPIEWAPAVITVSARLSSVFRQHLKNSIVIHVIWLVIAICLGLVVKRRFRKELKLVQIVILIFVIMSVTVVIFDILMAVIYIVHIQKSITYSMVVRHAGWSVNLKIQHPKSFGGWIVIVASCCWLRGIFFTALNIYCCKVINKIRSRVMKKEVRMRTLAEGNLPFPEPANEKSILFNTLYYRSGESQPFIVRDF